MSYFLTTDVTFQRLPKAKLNGKRGWKKWNKILEFNTGPNNLKEEHVTVSNVTDVSAFLNWSDYISSNEGQGCSELTYQLVNQQTIENTTQCFANYLPCCATFWSVFP